MCSLFMDHTTCVIFASFHQGKEEINIFAFLFNSESAMQSAAGTSRSRVVFVLSSIEGHTSITPAQQKSPFPRFRDKRLYSFSFVEGIVKKTLGFYRPPS